MASTKEISGYLYNVAQSFDASCEHIRYLLVLNSHNTFIANLLTGAISPDELAIERNRNLISMAQIALKKNVEPILGNTLANAELSLSYSGHNSVTTVIVKTHSGETWKNSITTRNPLVQP